MLIFGYGCSSPVKESEIKSDLLVYLPIRNKVNYYPISKEALLKYFTFSLSSVHIMETLYFSNEPD